MIISAVSISAVGSYYEVILRPTPPFLPPQLTFAKLHECDELSATISNSTRFDKDYPTCKSSPNITVPVRATMSLEKENVSAAFRVTFGTSVWVAILIHVLAVEIYVCDSLKK